MAFGWSKAQTSQPHLALPSAPPGGLVLLITDDQIEAASGPLASLVGALPRALAEVFSRHDLLQLEAVIAEREATTLDLNLQLAEQTLRLRVWCSTAEQGTYLHALPIEDLHETSELILRRLQTQLLVGQLAEQIRDCTLEQLQPLCCEALHRLSLASGLGHLGLAVLLDQQWQLYAHYSPQQALRWVSGMRLGSVLSLLPAEEPLTLSPSLLSAEGEAYLGRAPAMLVPYCEEQMCRVWLLIDGYASGIPAQDLQRLCITLARAVLERLTVRQQREKTQQLAFLQQELGACWWSYCPRTGELELAGKLATELQLGPICSLNEWLAFVHSAERDEVRLRLLRLGAEDELPSLEMRIRGVNEAAAYQWYRLRVGWQCDGHERKLNGFLLNVHQQMQEHAQAEAARVRLTNLLDRAPAVIYVETHNDEGFELSFCSESLVPLLGYRMADLQQGRLLDYIHPEDLSEFFARPRQLLRDGKVSCRYRLRDYAGRYHWLLDEAKLLRDEQGQIQEVVGLWLDISESMEAAEQIRQSEERYRILVEDSPAMICRFLPSLQLIFANRPLLAYLERSSDDLPGLSLQQFLSDEQQRAFAQRIAGLTPEQPVTQAEICVQLPGREHAWWVWAERGVFNEAGELLEIHAVGRDNTEVRRSQQQLNQSAKMATLGEMATGMAHEMNQPLHVMRMAVANVLRRLELGDLPPEYLQEKLQRVEAQVQRAARIVDHMRVFGRRSEIERQLFDPLKAIEGAVSLLQESLQGKGIQLHQHLAEPVEAQVFGHADQLEQVLINLVVNARDALLGLREQEPGRAMWIAINARLEDKSWVIEVEDNGGGIDPRLHERIFDPFFTTKEVGKGTGLGLSVSYNIIKQMEGEISLRNSENGALFCIRLPFVTQLQVVTQE